MAFMVNIKSPDGTPWITESGSSKEQVIGKLQARARQATSPSAKERLEDAISRLQSS